MAKIYVASSWSNWRQEIVVQCLEGLGHDVYDFKKDGFSWKEVMPSYDGDTVSQSDYLNALEHHRSIEGYLRDYSNLDESDATILVLPCGRSAHLELGYAIGRANQLTAILLDGDDGNNYHVTPDLMYKMVDHIATSQHSLYDWVGKVVGHG
jgi:hypothetical protein